MEKNNKEWGITKKKYSRATISKITIISISLTILCNIVNIFISSSTAVPIKAAVIILLSLSILLILINSFILKVEPNDERGRENYGKASEAAIVFVSKLGVAISIPFMFLLLFEKLPETIRTYSVIMCVFCIMLLTFAVREAYFLKYEKEEC